MTTYAVVIGTTTINSTGRWRMRMRKNYNDNNKVDSTDVEIEIEGDVVGGYNSVTATPLGVAQATKTYSDLVRASFNPVQVDVKVDATVVHSITPGQCFIGPHVTVFDMPDAEGNGGGRQRYYLGIYAKIIGNAFKRLLELDTSIAVVDRDGVVIKKIWKATAKGVSLSSAHAAVVGFKPNVKQNLLGSVEDAYQQKRTSGQWVWEASKGKVLWVEEKIVITPGEGWVPVKLADGDVALHEKMVGPQIVMIEGIVRGFERTIAAPPDHYPENGSTVVKLHDESPVGKPTRLSSSRNLWGRTFVEKYLVSDKVVPEPNHHGHEDFEFDAEPSDGGIAGSG